MSGTNKNEAKTNRNKCDVHASTSQSNISILVPSSATTTASGHFCCGAHLLNFVMDNRLDLATGLVGRAMTLLTENKDPGQTRDSKLDSLPNVELITVPQTTLTEHRSMNLSTGLVEQAKTLLTENKDPGQTKDSQLGSLPNVEPIAVPQPTQSVALKRPYSDLGESASDCPPWRKMFKPALTSTEMTPTLLLRDKMKERVEHQMIAANQRLVASTDNDPVYKIFIHCRGEMQMTIFWGCEMTIGVIFFLDLLLLLVHGNRDRLK